MNGLLGNPGVLKVCGAIYQVLVGVLAETFRVSSIRLLHPHSEIPNLSPQGTTLPLQSPK